MGKRQQGRGSVTSEDVTQSLRYKNLSHFAKIDKWPEGALKDCQELSILHPDYHITYAVDGRGLSDEGKAGYYASYIVGATGPWIYGESRADIVAAIVADVMKRKAAHERWRASFLR
jgi:hypothetical protein